MKRIIGKEIKPNNKGIHPLTFEIIENPYKDNIIYPTSIYDIDKDQVLSTLKKNIKIKDENLEKNLFKDFMEKPYVPIDNTFILKINNVNDKMISLEEFYKNTQSGITQNVITQNVIRVINSWFRINNKEYQNEIQKNIIINFFKNVLKDNNIIKSNQEIKNHLDKWFNSKNPKDFNYNLFSYILKI
jgi:hypothetical protein